ncbi:MAG: ArsC/Spx/MgsR family protein [Sulfurimonadaceae bacterium]|nr:ArsC/Spx/MgsR family protein [Sulfurimonadaceae bacterium]
MKIVIFYEKPGCATNAKQKRSLLDAGCVVIERNLLNHGMNIEELHAFLKPLPVTQWFNPNAPKIKSGEIDPSALSESAALHLLMMEPILIKRPLMAYGGQKLCGFDRERIELFLNKPLATNVSSACSAKHEPCKTK